MSVDGTDFCIPQQGKAVKGNSLGSHKYAGKSALRYELGVDILAGRLVWIQGPYPASKWPDIKIFNAVLSHFLEPGESVEADNGYQGHADKIKCPQNNANPPDNLEMKGRVRASHETLNGRLKNWGFSPRSSAMTYGLTWRCFVLVQLLHSSSSMMVNRFLKLSMKTSIE